MKIRYLLGLILILFVWTLVYDWYHGKFDKKDVKHDTIEVVKWDTLHDSVPDIRYEKVTKYVPVPDSILITDTITKEKVLPIVQRTYSDDSTYTAYVSGAKIDSFPRLDSISVLQKIIERTVTVTEKERKRHWRFGLYAGYGYGFNYKGFEPQIGGGVTYTW